MFDGNDGLGAEALAGRTVIGLVGVVDGPNAKYVHHFVLSGLSGDSVEMLYAWAPGSQPLVFPDNVGINLALYDGLNIQTHFDNPDLKGGIVDNSGVKLYLAAADSPRAMDYGVLQLGDPALNLKGQKVVGPYSKYTFECPSLVATKPITLFTHGLHMHAAGARMVTQHFRDGVQIGGT